MSISKIKMMNNGDPKGKGRASNTWTITEDDVLVESLQELCLNGIWEPSFGLKDEHLALLQTTMKSQLDCPKPKSRQEILGRANWLKKRYFAAKKMISEGGFMWDQDQMMLVGDREEYKTWAKIDKASRGLFRSPFLSYYSLEELYGNVVLGDKGSEKDEHLGANNSTDVDVRSQVPDCDELNLAKVVNGSDEMSGSSVVVMAASISAMGLKISGLGHKIDDLVSALSERKGGSDDLQAKLVGELKRIRGLEDFQVFRAVNILAMKHDLLRVFFTMPEEMKKSYILDLVRFGL